MFRKNKKVIEKSETYKEIEKLYKELNECKEYLKDAALKCYIRNAAMVCYIPMSPDWNAQGDRCREVQKTLIAFIGRYDTIRQDIINLMEKESSNWAEPLESHYIVERELTKIFK